MPTKIDSEPRLVYASLLSELRGCFNNLKKADSGFERELTLQREELLQLHQEFQGLKKKFESINVMVKVAGLSGIELTLPDTLRLTYDALCKLVVADAQQVANVTRRARAVESAYLNQLVRMNVVSAERHGRIKKFSATSL